MEMTTDVVVVGSYETNCYLLRKNGKVLIVDPGDDFQHIKDKIGLDQVVGILITHHHFDHVGALEECVNTYRVSVYDRNCLEEKEYHIDDFSFQVLFTPGHTNDSVSYYFKEEHMMLVGDFIFKLNIGRMDLGGNIDDMRQSISKMITFYQNHKDADLVLLPGHGESTTLEYEVCYNPYFKNL